MTEKEAVSLREFFIRMMDERDKRYEQRFQDQEKALKLATDSKGHMWVMLIALAAIIVSIGDAIVHAMRP